MLRYELKMNSHELKAFDFVDSVGDLWEKFFDEISGGRKFASRFFNLK